MIIQYCSDLHLEFPNNRRWLKQNPLLPKGDLLIIAGDCFHLGQQYKEYDFIKWASDNFESVYILPGNHEYYGGYDAATALEPMHLEIVSNVFLVNNETVTIQDTQFIFTTLWSFIDRNHLAILRGMMDFQQIKFNGKKITIDQFNTMHRHAFQYLEKKVATAGKKVVITHHLPSDHCNAPEFKNSALNPAFCVDKTEFIASSDISHWIYGHSHRNKPDFDIDGTRMITNQLGYVDLQEHHSFTRNKIIEFSSDKHQPTRSP